MGCSQVTKVNHAGRPLRLSQVADVRYGHRVVSDEPGATTDSTSVSNVERRGLQASVRNLDLQHTGNTTATIINSVGGVFEHQFERSEPGFSSDPLQEVSLVSGATQRQGFTLETFGAHVQGEGTVNISHAFFQAVAVVITQAVGVRVDVVVDVEVNGFNRQFHQGAHVTSLNADGRVNEVERVLSFSSVVSRQGGVLFVLMTDSDNAEAEAQEVINPGAEARGINFAAVELTDELAVTFAVETNKRGERSYATAVLQRVNSAV